MEPSSEFSLRKRNGNAQKSTHLDFAMFRDLVLEKLIYVEKND